MHGAIRAVAVLVCLFAAVAALTAQPRVDSRNSYERILLVLPIVGSGTLDDPLRPALIPSARGAGASATLAGIAPTPTVTSTILGYTWVPSDDGKFALTEIVMRDRSAFPAIIAAFPNVKAFIKGVHGRADIETEFKKFKKDFDSTKFGVNVQ